jgi:hypothetical protein
MRKSAGSKIMTNPFPVDGTIATSINILPSTNSIRVNFADRSIHTFGFRGIPTVRYSGGSATVIFTTTDGDALFFSCPAHALLGW